jgi:hypothetical protein
MFQKSLLKNFIKSFNTPDFSNIIKLVTKDKFIAEDANGAEFISFLSKMLNWTNCIREVKNNLDQTKADGIVYNKNKDPILVIELKSSDKKISDRKIVKQAFEYKNEKPTCKYVIISNFKQLDIYSDSSDVCFSLDMTSSESYTTLYALLNQSSLETNEIARLKKLSKSQDEITKEVYKEYSNFRLKLLNNLIENNKELSKENIFECANKLLDRFMFILFAEDRGLIPANSIDTVINQYENAKDGWDEVKPLYYYYKKYFHFIDVGNDKVNIPKYNGNLFKPDEKLENLIIDDEIIKDDLSHLSAYDFSDDVDVEVLGHIFEQSLNDLEKIKESLFDEHEIVDTRKKDGVFYTPKFITEYIINNTVAKLCNDKKEDLKLFDDVKDTKKAKEIRRNTLHKYREYLESLKIVDPACGSGAFLTACFRYLLSEHKWIQNELFKYEAGLFDYHDVDKQIIENNLFGVDINGASVGIAKLSLWLQTAKRDRPLSNLMGNIKSANSLTANWSELFPEIMANGGFDCVIGNPPYIMEDENKSAFDGLHGFECYQGKTDIWHLFTCKAIEISKDNGYISFIAKNQWLNSASASNMRKNIYANTDIKTIIDFGVNLIFENVGQQTMTFVLQKNKENKFHNINYIKYTKKVDAIKIVETLKNPEENDYTLITKKELPKNYNEKDNLTFSSSKIENILTKIDSKKNFEFDSKKEIIQGIIGAPDKAFIVKENELIKFNSKEKEYLQMLHTNTGMYFTQSSDKYIFYISKKNFDDKNIDDYSNIKNHFKPYKDELIQKKINYKTPDKPYFYLHRERDENFFKEGAKLVWAKRTEGRKFTYTNEPMYGTANLFFIKTNRVNLQYITALLNSKLFYFYMSERLKHTGDLLQIDKNQFMKIPLYVPDEIDNIINLVNIIIDSKEKIAKYKKHFDSLNAIDKIEIKEEIAKLETIVQDSIEQIDSLVYELYGLSSDEVKIVESKEE